GIRDFHVTGVQTCALPILVDRMFAPADTSISCPVTGVLTRMHHSFVCTLPRAGRALYIVVIAFNAGHIAPAIPIQFVPVFIKDERPYKSKGQKNDRVTKSANWFYGSGTGQKKGPSMTGLHRSSAALRPVAGSGHESADARR